MRKDYLVGLDLGQSQDYTALSVLEKVVKVGEFKEKLDPVYNVRYLKRFKLGTPYPEIVKETNSIMEELHRPVLVVDNTGVGRPVTDLFRDRRRWVYAINITGGGSVTHKGARYNVPKRDLVSSLVVLFQAGRLKIAASLKHAETLRDELLSFKVKINEKTAHESYEHAREGDHDDLVLSVALASWLGERWGTWTRNK